MMIKRQTAGNFIRYKKSIVKPDRRTLIVIWVLMLTVLPPGLQADATADCNVGSGSASTECGVNATASGGNSTAVGNAAMATSDSATSLGESATASGGLSTSLGRGSRASGFLASAIGHVTFAESARYTSLGAYAGINGLVSVTDSPAAIAIGYFANIGPSSPGAIAIGGSDGDVNTNTRGAESIGENAIAIGFESKATQAGAIALGGEATATGQLTTALGDLAEASGISSTAIGARSDATGGNSTAVGRSAEATGSASTAVGRSADATADNTTALGHQAKATANFSTALGKSTEASAISTTAVGYSAKASIDNATALGYLSEATAIFSTALGTAVLATGNNSTAVGAAANTSADKAIAVGFGARADKANSIALGGESVADGEGAIAIGNDVDGNGIGALAQAAGAIAIGADTFNDVAHSLLVGVPTRVVRDDGTTQILVNEKSAGNNVRTLFNVICDTCTPGFRFNQTLPNNHTWNFRMLQSGAFSVDDPATIPKEAEFRSGGDLKIGGTLIQSSSRALKTDIRVLEAEEVLSRLERLPVSEWSYKKDNGRVKHIGPMAEDFHALFKVGSDNKSISSLDTSGVALAAVKALKTENDLKTQKIAQLQHQIDELKDIVASMVVLNQSWQVEDRL